MHKVSIICAAVLAASLSANAGAQGLFGSRSSGQEADPRHITAQAQAFADKQEDWVRPFALALYREGEWGSVLNLSRLGLAAMEKQRFALARRAFDEAAARVESVYADDPNATKARSVFNQEKVKDFKGEPYERAMLYYYRGLLYVQEGDYQNARASFLAADRHDTLSSSEDQAFVGNFGMMKYLAGWASHCDGDGTRAAQLVGEARSIDAKIRALPEATPDALVLVDSGPAPTKWGDGKHKELLKFKAGDGIEPAFALARGNATIPAAQWLIGDLNFQATTRGGREVDAILAGKARFKDAAGNIGDASMQIGQQVAVFGALSGNRDMSSAGLIGMFAGLVAKGIEHATTPAADVRGWDTLPGKVSMLQAPEGGTEGALQLQVSGTQKPLAIVVKNGSCSLAWGRTGSALPAELGGAARFEDLSPVEANRGDRNKSFRAMLADELFASSLMAAK